MGTEPAGAAARVGRISPELPLPPLVPVLTGAVTGAGEGAGVAADSGFTRDVWGPLRWFCGFEPCGPDEFGLFVFLSVAGWDLMA